MLGWSQAELAKAANVSRQTIADLERGARICPSVTISRVSSRLFLGPCGAPFPLANVVDSILGPRTHSSEDSLVRPNEGNSPCPLCSPWIGWNFRS
ncbi:helix-turn-helix domain-containing protein [Rhizobium calliandrae]|uniref:Helix-turn-helix domain-containing protein n=2 Tax=Rhizobium calliandrae TaxID=1312182 RepID=A0ABT7KN84_9HYPH|nr:helix-turn-helix domain-containing protein [Rhizobium calliandrae]MDL2408709.1 helix-turn-helix domain-containing protein [Rhizobium calliandrae]